MSIRHATAADSSFSVAGRAAWDAEHINDAEIVDARDFLPSGYATDASVDYTTELSTFLTEAAGRYGRLPKGRFLHTGLTITSSMLLEGESADFAGNINVASLVYNGTGVGLTVGASGSKIYNSCLRNFRLEATGDATTGANVVGLKFINSNYGVTQNIVVKGHGGGVGILATATAGDVGASNSFFGNFVWGNLVGYKFDGASGTEGDFASSIHGGAVIGPSTAAGTKCLWVTANAAEVSCFGVDFETSEYIVDLYGNGTTNGGGVKLIGCRTEFQGTKQIRINTNTYRTILIGHRFVGGAEATDWLDDSGTLTTRLDADSPVQLGGTSAIVANNFPINFEEAGGTARTVLKMASTDTLQIGSSVNSSFPLGPWHFATALYPGNDAGASQSNAAIRAGSGAPNNANGNNGDFYLRSDGFVSSNTVAYHKEGGSWVAFTTT